VDGGRLEELSEDGLGKKHVCEGSQTINII